MKSYDVGCVTKAGMKKGLHVRCKYVALKPDLHLAYTHRRKVE